MFSGAKNRNYKKSRVERIEHLRSNAIALMSNETVIKSVYHS